MNGDEAVLLLQAACGARDSTHTHTHTHTRAHAYTHAHTHTHTHAHTAEALMIISNINKMKKQYIYYQRLTNENKKDFLSYLPILKNKLQI